MHITLKIEGRGMKAIKIASAGLVIAIAGCAGQIKGAVMPYGGGQYQAVSIAGNRLAVLKITDHDAKITCKNEGKDRYVVISQEVVFIPLLDIDTGNAVIDVLGKIVSHSESHANKEDYEATTIFKCT